jgi:hypothetical protein
MSTDTTIEEALVNARASVIETEDSLSHLANGETQFGYFDGAREQLDPLQESLSEFTTMMAHRKQGVDADLEQRLAAVKATEIEAALWPLAELLDEICETSKGSTVRKHHAQAVQRLCRPLMFLISAFMILTNTQETES